MFGCLSVCAYLLAFMFKHACMCTYVYLISPQGSLNLSLAIFICVQCACPCEYEIKCAFLCVYIYGNLFTTSTVMNKEMLINMLQVNIHGFITI